MNFPLINSFISNKVIQLKFPNTILLLLLFFIVNYSNSLSQSLTAEQIYKKVSGAVVVVHAYDENDKFSAQGSGVVINDKGYVVTNYHVLSGNERLEILHGKEVVPYVDIIGIDVEKDILILKIEAKKFPAIKIGDSKSLNIGQRVYAIGSPMGLENSISEGIISGLRSVDESKRNFIQITASISTGSSGGAVVNDKGELIGISTLTAMKGQNLNFAIPIDEVANVEISSYSQNSAYKDFEIFKKGYDANEKGNYKDAVKYYSLFIHKYPNSDKAYINRGNTKVQLSDFKGAIEDYNKAIEINSNNDYAYSGRGNVKAELSDYRGAINDYTKAIELNPSFAVAFNNRWNAKSNLEDYRGAIQDYNTAIELDPSDATAYNNRGIAKAKLENYKGAIQDFSRAIELNPSYEDAYYNRGIAKRNLEDYRGAIQDYNKALELNPSHAVAYYNRGNAKRNLEDYRGAIQDYNKAIELNPSDAGVYINRGIAKSILEDYQGATQDYNKAIELNPSDAGAYYNRGIVKANLGDINGACLDWSKAGELGYYKAYNLIKEYCGK